MTVVEHARVVAMDGHRVEAVLRDQGQRVEISAERIVGADGRASFVRRSLGIAENSALLSYMASVELRGVELPFEGLGHVILGGPGPALLYRISQDTVRGCLDVPLHHSRTPAFLWDAWHSVLPASIVPAFRRALEEGPVMWAANRFRPRAEFGKGTVALAGDALGHVHPMTAIGLSMGFLDAEALAADARVDRYARARRGYVAELLSNALYHCFRREDASAAQVRETMFRVLRKSPVERTRTMQILCAQEESTSSFGSAFLRIAAGAIGSTVVQATRRAGLRSVPAALSAYGEWMQWPAASLLPAALGDAFRARSTSTHPLPFLSGVIPVNDAPPVSAPARPAPPTGKAMSAATDLLIRELEAIAMKLGKVPDDVLGVPAMRMMRAITATEMRTGVAARMLIGRRRLTSEGFPRLLGAQRLDNSWGSPAGDGGAPRPAFSTSLAAELLLVLLDGSTWVRWRIQALEDGVAALLAREVEEGGFSAGPIGAGGRAASDMHATALTCAALAIVRRRMPGVFDARIDPALARAARWVREQQAPDGAFAAEKDGDRLAATAWAMEALAAAEQNPTDPAIRRAVRWLIQTQDDKGAFNERPAAARPHDAKTRRSTAHALRALLLVKAPHRDAIDAAVALIATALAEGRHEEPCAGIAPWEECWEALLALALHDAQAKSRPEPRHGAAAASAEREPAQDDRAEADWRYCRDRLAEVSRTFSKPIALLSPGLEVATTLGYLLCRVADTIEDHPAVPRASREPLFAAFLDVLHGRKEPDDLAASFGKIRGEDAELTLARNLPVVMRVLRAQPGATRASVVRWISEMARGMALYAHRDPGSDGLVALTTVADLERYCYFVAGTVGHLLTDLFLEELGDDATPEISHALRVHAEAFGAGLQLVNILKDLTDDRQRRWSYIPRTACAARSIGVADLSDPSRRAAAHAAVAPLFDIARRNLDDGLRYTLTIPPRYSHIRLFCLLPLWMAARTLVIAKGNDAMFTPGVPVKISRDEVEALAAACVTHHADDSALRASYALLWGDTPGTVRRSAS